MNFTSSSREQIDSFILQRSRDGLDWQTNSCPQTWSCQATLSGQDTIFADQGSASNFYRMKAIAAGQESEWGPVIRNRGGDAFGVMLSASILNGAVSIEWMPTLETAHQFHEVYSRAEPGDAWSLIGTTAMGSTSFTDIAALSTGDRRDYRVKRIGKTEGTGYISVANEFELSAMENGNRGTVILIVDETVTDDLSKELSRLQKDLVGDGWIVVRRDVPRHVPSHDSSYSTRIQQTKDTILDIYHNDPKYAGSVDGVILVGHVPIPYTGTRIATDGHPSAIGARPTDWYYADMSDKTNWTDVGKSDSQPFVACGDSIMRHVFCFFV